jgi:hypothetical protein
MASASFASAASTSSGPTQPQVAVTISIAGKEPHAILVKRDPAAAANEPTDDKPHTVNWTGKHDGGALGTGPTSTFEANLVLAVVEAKVQAEEYMKGITQPQTAAPGSAAATSDAKRVKTGSESEDA